MQNLVNGIVENDVSVELVDTRVVPTKTFTEKLNEIIPEDFVLSKHEKIINSDDNTNALKGIDLYYKLTGKYAPDKSVHIDVTLAPEHNALVTEFEDKLRATLLST